MQGVEPINARDLHDQLVAAGCTFNHQVGSHLSGTGPNGQTIRIPDPGSAHHVTTLVVKELGRQFGRNLHDTRIWLGYGTPGRSKMTTKRASKIVRNEHTPVKVPDLADICQHIKTTADGIYRNPQARVRGSGLPARTQLHDLARAIDAWHRGHGGAA